MTTKTEPSPYIQRLEDLRYPEWHGMATKLTIPGIATRMRALLVDQHITTTTVCTSPSGYTGQPDVRTGQHIEPGQWIDGNKEAIRVRDLDAHISFITDSFVWGIDAGPSISEHDKAWLALYASDAKPEQLTEAERESHERTLRQATKITFRRGQMIIEQYSMSKNHLWWIFSVENREED